jgi:hypothetical protein
MVTRRTVLRHGVYATVSAAAAAVVGRTVRAQATPAGAFDFFISPGGSDSNPGTYDRPWSITAINTRQRDYAGKRVGLLDGTYNAYAACHRPGPGDGTWVGLAVNGGPSATSPTVVAAVNARKAILTNVDPTTGAPATSGMAIIGQGYLQVPNRGNLILDGLYINHAWGAAIFFLPFFPSGGAAAKGGATGIIIRNCEISNIDGVVADNVGAIKLRQCTGVLVSNNTIHSVQPNPLKANPGNASGIFSFKCLSNIYEYNTVFDCNSGIHDKNDHNGNHTYRYNHVESTGTYAANVLMDCSGGDPGDVVTAHNNLLIGPPNRAIWDGQGIVMPSKQSLVFYNNTCVGGGFFYPAGGPQSSPPAMVTLYNNILTSLAFCSGSVALSNYNVFTVTGGIIGLRSVSAPLTYAPFRYTLSDWQKATGHDRDSTTFGSDPKSLFLAAAKLDAASYQLQSSAAARNLGRIGGKASGAVTDAGAWGGGATRIGCDFGPTPRSPKLNIS